MARDLILGESPRNWSRDFSGADPLVWTPSAVRAELSKVRDLLDLVDREVSQAFADGKVTAPERTSWRQTYASGLKFVSAASPLWGSNVAVAHQHAAEADKWRTLVRKRGGRVVGPEDAGRRIPPESRKVSATHVVLLGVAGAAAAALLVSAVKK